MIPCILKIKKVEPYKITCVWNTKESRIIDLEDELKKWATSKDSPYFKLLDKNIFLQVKLDKLAKTISWENLAIMINTNGERIPAPLDFCPDFLYKISKPV
ncbi:MAG: DUF2442 domain-containing protein [Bacteroidia bacterium]|nr:DUF2442 domain-containing protein [Bacteroidia bacterium]